MEQFSFLEDTNGLTMIEVLMAMAIFTIGFLAVGTMVIGTTRNNTTGNIITQATMLARERIEFLKTLPLEDMNDECKDENEPEHLGKIFERVCHVPAPISGAANIIEVTVRWNRRGQNQRVVLRTITRGNGT